jgi:uncharacterized membrane protein YcjF (UPF0283 family)
LTGLAWTTAGWTGCVALIVAMQLVMAVIVQHGTEILGLILELWSGNNIV